MKICPICSEGFENKTICPHDGATLILKSTLDDALIGKVLKEAYRIEEKVGAGGMGAVYRVTQIRLGRSVALKVLLPKFNSTPDMVRRFFREARILSQLNHPNIISIIDFGNTEDGLVYMVMEYLEGYTLSDYVPHGKGLSEDVLMHLMGQICQGMASAHEVPLIHRDLKPGNIFLAKVMGKGWTVKVLDFGISKILGDTDESLTQTGMMMGTPGYIAPELIAGTGEPSVAGDIYALGGILYFLMGGRSPYHQCTGRTALIQQLKSDPEPIPVAQLTDPKLEKLFPVVLKAMQREPSARYPSALAMLQDLCARTNSSAHLSDPLLQLPDMDAATEPTLTHSQYRDSTDTSRQSQGEIRTVVAAPQPRSRSKWLWAGVVMLVLSGLLWGAWQILNTSSKAPLIFGMSADFSGSNRELGREMQLGIQTCFAEINEAGGVSGRLLELIALDDGYEPEPAKANMLDLIQNRDVFAVIGNVGTPTAKAAIPVVLENKTLFFGPFTGAGILRKDPPDRYVFNYRASYQEETAAIVRYFVKIRNVPPESIAVFSQNDSYGDDGFRGVVRTLREFNIAEQDILHVRYERNQFALDDALAQVLANPDRASAIVTIGTYKQTARFISEVKAGQPETLFSSVSFVGASALAEAFLESDPAMAEGVIVSQVVPFFKANATGVIRYRESLAQFAPNQHPSFVSLEGYIAAKILIEGLKQAKEMNTEALIDALESITDLDLGTGSLISFSPSRHQASHKVWAVRMDGKAQFEELALD